MSSSRRAGRLLALLLLVGTAAGAPPPLTAQSDSFPVEEVTSPAADTLPAAAVETSEIEVESPTDASDPLPAPSFRRAYWHLFLAFGVAWALMFLYVVVLDRRIGQARREVERMREP